MGTYTSTTVTQVGTWEADTTTCRREIVRFPLFELPETANKITSINLYVYLRTGYKLSTGKGYWAQQFILSNQCNAGSVASWTDRLANYGVWYQYPANSNTYFDASHWSLLFPTDHVLLNVQATLNLQTSGNAKWHSVASLTPTEYGQDPAHWRNQYIFLGSYFVKKVSGLSSSSYSGFDDCYWQNGVAGQAITVNYEDNNRPESITIVHYPYKDPLQEQDELSPYTIYNPTPWFGCSMGTDPDGDNVALYYLLVDQTANHTGIIEEWGEDGEQSRDEIWQCPQTLTVGHEYQLVLKERDSNGLECDSATSVYFKIESPPEIPAVGDKIDDSLITALQTAVNNVEEYYGITPTAFQSCEEGTGALDDYIDELEEALESLPFSDSEMITSVDPNTPISLSTIQEILNTLQSV